MMTVLVGFMVLMGLAWMSEHAKGVLAVSFFALCLVTSFWAVGAIVVGILKAVF